MTQQLLYHFYWKITRQFSPELYQCMNLDQQSIVVRLVFDSLPIGRNVDSMRSMLELGQIIHIPIDNVLQPKHMILTPSTTIEQESSIRGKRIDSTEAVVAVDAYAILQLMKAVPLSIHFLFDCISPEEDDTINCNDEQYVQELMHDEASSGSISPIIKTSTESCSLTNSSSCFISSSDCSSLLAFASNSEESKAHPDSPLKLKRTVYEPMDLTLPPCIDEIESKMNEFVHFTLEMDTMRQVIEDLEELELHLQFDYSFSSEQVIDERLYRVQCMKKQLEEQYENKVAQSFQLPGGGT